MLQNPQECFSVLTSLSGAPAEPPPLSPMWKEAKDRPRAHKIYGGTEETLAPNFRFCGLYIRYIKQRVSTPSNTTSAIYSHIYKTIPRLSYALLSYA